MPKIAETRTCPLCGKDYVYNLERNEGECACTKAFRKFSDSCSEVSEAASKMARTMIDIFSEKGRKNEPFSN